MLRKLMEPAKRFSGLRGGGLLSLIGLGACCVASSPPSAQQQAQKAAERDLAETQASPQRPLERRQRQQTGAKAGPRAAVGTNLARPDYGTGSYAFVDAMHHANPFHSGTVDQWDDGRALQVDRHGWVTHLAPGQIARTYIYAGGIRHPTGKMTVLYDGKGRIEYRGRVSKLRRTPGKDVFLLQGQDGLYLEITKIAKSDPIRNIRVLQPGGRCSNDRTLLCESKRMCEKKGRCVPFVANYDREIFYPPFLRELQPYGALRFMDWMHTNREVALADGEGEPEPTEEWGNIPTRKDAHWTPVPVSVMVELANTVGADAWFNVPHTADDDLVRRMAQTIHESLDPDLKAYVEYSNETWNTIFDQYRWVNVQGCSRYSKRPERECGTDAKGDLCPTEGAWDRSKERCQQYGRKFHALRTVEIMDIFQEVFGGERKDRVIRVLAGQVGTVDGQGKTMLDLPTPDGTPVYRHIDVFATAPYFGDESVTAVDQAFIKVSEATHGAPAGTYRVLTGRRSAKWGGVYSWIRSDVEALQGYPEIELVAYEGGQHFFSFEDGKTEMIHRINRDPRMKSVYLQYLRVWSRLTGGTLFMHFTSPAAWTKFGAFGIKEYLGQPRGAAPKHDAVLTFMEGGSAPSL